jgi:glycosyltransferase involved in cell wall biosynthesis
MKINRVEDLESQKKHVLMIVENNSVPFDRRVWYEATSLRDEGWMVTIICPVDEKPPVPGFADHIDGITVYRFPLEFAEMGIRKFLQEYVTAFISIARLTRRVWRESPFDIIHICNPPDIFFPIGLFYRLRRARFIFDHHDLFPENVSWRYRSFGGRLLYLLSRLFEFLTYQSANLVIATNESYKQIGHLRDHVRGEKIVVVRNGPKLKEFTPIDILPDLKRGFRFMACFVGLMGNEDGLDELVEIIRYTVLEFGCKNILFTLIGDGPKRKTAEDRLRELGLKQYVDMPGLIRNDLLLRQYMSSADIFLSPEPWTPMNDRSTFIKIGEYMIMGKPIVAFDLKETRYTARDAAVYVYPGDIQGYSKALVDLIHDEEKRFRMGSYGHQRVINELCWEQQKTRLFHAYRVALGDT